MNARLALFALLCLGGCTNLEGTAPDVGVISEAIIGDALPGLNAEEQGRFVAGREAFDEVENVREGLGPVFNERACGRCHDLGGSGGAGKQFEMRAGQFVNNVFSSLTSQGGQLFDLFSVTNLEGDDRQQVPNCMLPRTGEAIPSTANVQVRRRSTSLFGLGLVDNTPDNTFTTLAASQPVAIRGRTNSVFNISAGQNTVGKFGWKSQVPSLFQFSGDAYLNEMGITSPQFMVEQPPSGDASLVPACDLLAEPEDEGDDIEAFTDFMQLLAPVPTTTQNADAQAGNTLFTQLGCDGCHVRTLMSGSGSSVAALNNQTYHPYSDFLLHDMGSLGDGIGDNGTAGLHEMRTAPLWGIRLLNPKTQLLHDGRATSMADAILRHDGQGLAARNAFAALATVDRNKVVAFINTL
jgi:CxxC motif-containing protein (DUF1111 family)